jgi:PAS domain S-box-containing protein
MRSQAKASALLRRARRLGFVLVAVAVVGMTALTTVDEVVGRGAAESRARTELLRLATLTAAQVAQDASTSGTASALTHVSRTLAIPTSGMGFYINLLSKTGVVLAATTGAPVEEGGSWPLGPLTVREQTRPKLSLRGDTYLVTVVQVGGTEWTVAALQDESSIVPATGVSRWLVLLVLVLAVVAVGVVLHNTAVRAMAQEDRSETEATALALVEMMEGVGPAALVNVDTGEFIRANQDLARIVGFERGGSLEGRQWREFSEDYVAARFDSLFAQALFQGVARGAEVPLPDDRGGTSYLDVLVKRLWTGRPEVLVICTEATERRMMQDEIARRTQELERRGRRLEEQLARTVAAAARYRNLITHAPDPIVVADGRTHRILEVNPQAEQELGMSYDQLRGAPLSVIDASRGLRIEELLEQAAREGVVRNADLVAPTASGQPPKYIEATIAYLSAGEEELFHLILRDVTAQRAVRAQVEDAYERMAAQARRLEEVNEQLRRATEAKSYFLATVSHELRAPLNSIIGFTELLLDETYGPLTERQKEFLQDVQRGSTHLLKLINDVLELARMEAKRITLRPAPCSVPELLRDVYSLTRGAASDKRQHIEYKAEHDHLMVMADEHRTKQILINLVTNALKYSPADTTVRMEARVSGLDVVFSVADQGQGIAPEDQERIFREFERVERGRQTAATGFGLGLPLAKHLVELHGGRIWLDSSLGVGTTFYFTLPRFEVEIEGEGGEPFPPAEDAAPAESRPQSEDESGRPGGSFLDSIGQG